MFEKSKMLLEMKKIQSVLAKEIIEVEAGNGAVKVQKISLDPELVRDADLVKLEKWIESAVTQAITKSQQAAADKMKGVAGGLGLPGF